VQTVVRWNLQVNSDTAISTSRALALKEGLLVGISSGAAVAAALKVREELRGAASLRPPTRGLFGDYHKFTLQVSICWFDAMRNGS
jgi:cysteine synthase